MTIDNMHKLLKRKDVNNKIIRSLDKTRDNKNEHAFDFCSGNNVSTTDIEEGNEYHITLRNKCPMGTKSVGNFHTHVHLSESNNDAIPSSGDMMETIERDLNFVCVSGHDNNGGSIIRCFDHNDIKSEIGNVLSLKKLELNEDNVRKSSRLITKRMMKDKDYLDKMSHVKI
jgi:hypothetical protein